MLSYSLRPNSWNRVWDLSCETRVWTHTGVKAEDWAGWEPKKHVCCSSTRLERVGISRFLLHPSFHVMHFYMSYLIAPGPTSNVLSRKREKRERQRDRESDSTEPESHWGGLPAKPCWIHPRAFSFLFCYTKWYKKCHALSSIPTLLPIW